MLELQGRKWLTDYVTAKYNTAEKEMLYRVYVTESIKAYLKLEIGYWEMLNQGKNEHKEERSAEEIKLSFMNRLNGE